MRKILICLFLSSPLLASVNLEQEWLSVYKISQRHPVYRSGELIQRPAGTFQLLFSLHYFNSAGISQQDCIWFRVPDPDKRGELRVTQGQDKCESWLENIRFTLDRIRSLRFTFESNQLTFQFTNDQAKLRSLQFRLLNLPQAKKSGLFDSSVQKREFKGVFFLSPHSESETLKGLPTPLLDQDCSFETGTCQRCAQGVIKIYAGDETRYKCGIDRCGEKGEFACFRGREWKREREKPSCRLNSWHLYCQQGLRLECEGELGFCR